MLWDNCRFYMKLNACLASFESFKRLVSQFHNFAVAKNEQFWQATGQSNMANRMEDWVGKPNFGSSLQQAFCTLSLIVQWPARTFDF